jgi:1,4-dihydroxy-2-naphthoate octaprenyltransferase
MKPSPLRRAFVTNDLLIVIAVLAVWLAVTAPLYVRIIERFSRRDEPPALLAQLSALGLAAVGAALALVVAVAFLGGLIWLGEQAWTRLKRTR